MRLEENYSAFAHAKSNAQEKIFAIVRDFFPFIILIFNIAIAVALRLFMGWIENPFNAAFFISLGTNILTTMFSYVVFIPYGERSELALMSSHHSIMERWGQLSQKVRDGMGEAFSQYCKDVVTEERLDIRRAILANRTMISWEKYVDLYEGKTAKEIRRTPGLTRSEARAVIKANSRIKVKPVRPLLVLCGVSGTHINDAGRSSSRYGISTVALKPLSMFIVSACLTMFKGRFVGVSDASVVYDMIFSAAMIVVSSVMGFSTGTTKAKKDHSRIKARVVFLETFLEKKKVAP